MPVWKQAKRHGGGSYPVAATIAGRGPPATAGGAGPQDVAPHPAKRPVLARVVSTVTRIPGWVSSNVVGAAAWVVDLPGHVVRLPERRFL